MSADYWRACPKCMKKKLEHIQAYSEYTKSVYGSISQSEYVDRIDREKAMREKEAEATLREDYEIRTDDNGMFSVIYSSHCERCGHEFKFKTQADTLQEKSKN